MFCATLDDVPDVRGAYVLLIEMRRPMKIKLAGKIAGALAPGRYLYCGSAKGPGGLRARIARHMRRRKAVRWHVDQLTTRGLVHGAWVFPDECECALVTRLAHLPAPIPGFGASDCAHCRSHLLQWPEGTVVPLAGATEIRRR